jgi:tetratricopeptide (TPR) repeat protein
MTKSEMIENEISNIESLKLEVEKNPTDINNHLRLGWSYYGEDKMQEAVDTFQGGIQRFPGDVELLYALALSLKKLGKDQEALKLFKEIVSSVNELDDQIRGEMLRRLALGHANILERGDWDLSGEIWERK